MEHLPVKHSTKNGMAEHRHRQYRGGQVEAETHSMSAAGILL